MNREELPFEVIQTWKPEQLKEFCRKRDLKVSGPKAELVARVFAAAEMGIAIKPTAQYFAQVQGEMAITKRPLCYFFVYTQKGYHLETIRFNATYWCRLEENLIWFYINCLLPALKLLQK